MKTIYRYDLKITDYQEISLQGDPLSVAVSRTDENWQIDLWALHSKNATPRRRGIYIFGTGNPIDVFLELSFIGTVVSPNGLVWHVFHGPLQGPEQ